MSCSALRKKEVEEKEATARTLAAEVERQHLMEATNAYHSCVCHNTPLC